MSTRKSPQVSTRKPPQQARSTALVQAILQAAVQVLATEGAARFTTARVAERAGVSVGSVYQYFPNKAAILFKLQSDEWQATVGLLRALLADRQQPALQRLRALVRAFMRSECEEAGMRGALHDAAPLYRDAPEAREVRAAGQQLFVAFVEEVLPRLPSDRRLLVAQTISRTLSAVGKDFSASPRAQAEIDAHADALADMLCAYITSLGHQAGAPRRSARAL